MKEEPCKKCQSLISKTLKAFPELAKLVICARDSEPCSKWSDNKNKEISFDQCTCIPDISISEGIHTHEFGCIFYDEKARKEFDNLD